MADIYIDEFRGNDSTGTGSQSAPYKTLQKIINPISPILTPQDTIYYVNTQIGQPKYVFNLFDTVFWEDEESTGKRERQYDMAHTDQTKFCANDISKIEEEKLRRKTKRNRAPKNPGAEKQTKITFDGQDAIWIRNEDSQ